MPENKTGYPSIDKPWMKYYDENCIARELYTGSIYGYMHDNNLEHLDDVALVYFGRRITYRELFKGIDEITVALYGLGIGSGDVITGITLSFPEAIYAFYGANKLGAVTNWLDPRLDIPSVVKDLKATNTKLVLLFDELTGKFGPMLSDMGMPVIIFSADDSLPWYLKFAFLIKSAFAKNRYEIEGAIRYPELIGRFAGESILEIPEMDAHALALLEHTGGTTGKSKVVMLTNGNVNAVVEQYRHGGTSLARDHSWLSVAFPFVAYAVICSQHLPLSLGMTSYLCYDLDAEHVAALVLKNRINHMANTPIIWEMMIHGRRAKGADFSFLVSPTVGADALGAQKEEDINAFLEQHGCTDRIVKGYGMTEVGSAVSVCPSNECNKLGSVGLPFMRTVISIFDEATDEELPYGHQGEICIMGPTVMRGYLNDEEETKNVLKLHPDGLLWMHSGDLGRMDEDGFLFIDGRIKRMLIDHDGFKIFAPRVEDAIQGVAGVDKCCVVGAPDERFGIGQKAVAFIISDGSCSEEVLISVVDERCRTELADYAVPSEYVLVGEFPYTGAGKVDYRELERRAAE